MAMTITQTLTGNADAAVLLQTGCVDLATVACESKGPALFRGRHSEDQLSPAGGATLDRRLMQTFNQ